MRKTEVVYLPGEEPRQPQQHSPEEIRQHLKDVQNRKTDENPITQATHLGRAAMHLLGRRMYAKFSMGYNVLTPDVYRRVERFPIGSTKYQLSIHETTVPGEPARVSLVASRRHLGVDSYTQAISLPQHEVAAEAFAKSRSGLFVMDGTARSFASDEPRAYEQRLVHNAGLLLDLMDQVEVVLPEADELEDHIAA